MFDKNAIAKHFHHAEFRDGQREAIEYAVDAFNSGKRVVILEAPTGAGKSAIATCLANMVRDSYYLTVTKILQDQLVREFGDELVELKGRSSYPCTYWPLHGPTLVRKKLITQKTLDANLAVNHNCSDGYCVSDAPEEDKKGRKCFKCFVAEGDSRFAQKLPAGMKFSSCPYYEQLGRAVEADKVVMNFHAFLYQTQLSRRFDRTRELLILDEAHNTESIMLDFISITLDDRVLKETGLELPQFAHAAEYAIWFEQHNVGDVLADCYNADNSELTRSDDPKRKQALLRRMDDLGRLLRRYKSFMENISSDHGSEWVAEFGSVESHGQSYNRVVLKPVTVDEYVHNHLFKYGEYVLLTSATILDLNAFCKSVGLKRSEVAAYQMKNRFPVESRPIYYKPVVKVTGGGPKQNEWGPKIVDAVQELVRKYPGKRGIVHTHNFAIADMLFEQCGPDVRKRFSYQKNFVDKQALLEYHAFVDDSVILAPAMHEGVDLAGDLSRFQIIAKTPYPNCYDNKQMARRMELDSGYYSWIVALKLVQSYGRSVRSDTDYADTFIIDGAFESFYQRSKKMLPSWFREAIIWP